MPDDDSIRAYHDTDAVIEDVECTLTDAEAASRAEWVDEAFVPHLTGIEEVEDGYTFVLAKTDAALEAAATLVMLESRCCAAQDYTLDVPADGEPRLTVTGPEGTKALAEEGFFERFEDAPEVSEQE